MVITASAPMVAGTGRAVVGTLTCRTMAMPLSSHTTAGAGQLGTLLRSQPPTGRQEVCGPVPTGPGRYRAADPAASRADSTSQNAFPT
jgi:hypothetical protein